jgi:predicted NUDIX family NTP pyrophosphohydrolase
MKTGRKSAGILVYKPARKSIEVFLVHPGGPFWKNKDAGAWSIPKGEFTDEENALDAAIREFKEETGIKIAGDFMELTPVTLKSGKIVHAWAVEGDIDTSEVKCESFIDIEWPPRTGKTLSIPEVDKGEWFPAEEAKQKINPAQAGLIDELMNKVID